jgi:hypothetical protein
MKNKIVIELLLKDKMRRSKVKPFDQTLKNLGVIFSQQKLVTK